MITKILLEKIEYFLKNPSNQFKNFDDVAFEAVSHTLSDILLISHVPYRFLDATEEFLLEEAWDMIRKKTYGFRNLQEYQKNYKRHTKNLKKTKR